MKKRFKKFKHTKKRSEKLTKKEKSHWKQFGEQHPIEDTSEEKTRIRVVEDTKAFNTVQPNNVNDSSESEAEDLNPYSELLLSIGKDSKVDNVLTDDSSDSSSEIAVTKSSLGKKRSHNKQKKQRKNKKAHIDTETDTVNNDIKLVTNLASNSAAVDSIVATSKVSKKLIISDDDQVTQKFGNKNKNGLEITSEDEKNGEDLFDRDSVESDENDHASEGDENPKENLQELAKDDYRCEDYVLNEDVNDGDFLKPNSDPFVLHFEKDLDESIVNKLGDTKNWTKEEVKLPIVGSGTLLRPTEINQTNLNFLEKDLKKLGVKQSLCASSIAITNKKNGATLPTNDYMTPEQHILFSILNSYQDLLFPCRHSANAEEIRLIYCLHALNHVLKTRSRVIAHSSKIKAAKEKNAEAEEYRDQGLTRPKVLIVVPFRESALRIVKVMSSLMLADQKESKMFITNKKRFLKEYSEEESDKKKGNKPDDFKETFTGNIDDHFRFGIGIAKKSIKLYTEFYSSDIIIASPLGLRTVIGAAGDKERDYDFLSSIEVLILDQTDIFLMQNWDHVLHLMKHLHLQPQSPHGIDFSRVRMWTLNGWSKYFRQTIVCSNIQIPEITALFNKHCSNFAGKIMIPKIVTSGVICQVVVQLPQVFRRLDVSSYGDLSEARFQYFVSKVLKEFKEKDLKYTMVFLPSYFDFVRLRNFLRKEEVQFVHVCEYSKEKSISRARTFFYHGQTQFLLYTERCHFYRSELCNMLTDSQLEGGTDNSSCTVIYSRFDVQKLSAVVGMERASRMINSDTKIHMLLSGD